MNTSATEQRQLTTEQILALRTNRNISVTANAGSGKTFVLVERYRKIIEEQALTAPGIKADTSSILAITFTRKAAAEMKKKVINAFDAKLTELQVKPHSDPEELERLKRIREGLTYANISTIHSFCSSLLRQFPIEAEVPVNFSELSEAEKLKLIDTAIDTTMEVMLESTNKSEKEKIEFLLRKFTRRELKELVTTIIYKIEIFNKIETFFSYDDKEITELILKDFIIDDYGIDEDFISDMKRIVEIISADDFLDKEKKGLKTAENLFEQLSRYGQNIIKFQFNAADFKSLENFAKAFLEIAKLVYTQKFTLKDFFQKNIANTEYIKELDEKKEILPQVADLIKILESFNELKEYLTVSRILWEFTKEVREMNDEAKLHSNGLDFDDLQLKVQKLLQNEAVVKKIRSQIRYIMIDEFQDTNELQYSIIKALVPEIKTKITSDDDVNLFIVGDPKQSIYGFRNADVRVFYEAVDDISTFNDKCNPPDSADNELIKNAERRLDNKELLGINKLTSTFRLRPAIAAFVNMICDNIMYNKDSEDKGRKYEVEYTPLVCSKDTDKIRLIDDNNISDKSSREKNSLAPSPSLPFIENDENTGEVVFLLSHTPGIDEDEDYEDIYSEDKEEKLIADFISDIVSRQNKKYQYKDIAILSRTKSRFTKLSRVLLAQDIPFVIHGGNAFYRTEEINDFIAFFKFLYNPDDDLALLAILRSPFFNISDTTILIIDKSSNGHSVWQKLKHYALSIKDEKIKNIYELLNEFLQQAPAMSISQVILKIIEKTGWMGIIETKPDKQQKIANIDKFIQIARDYEDIGFRNIYDFVEELAFIIEKDLMESEAAVLTDENAVNIMSVHAAKGLQFPVVILYNVNKKTGGNKKYTISGEFGPGFPLKIDTDEVFEKKTDSIINIINKRIAKQKEEAEEKRVLYVAMTRAEDILALSIHSKASKRAETKLEKKLSPDNKKNLINMYAPLGQMKLILEGMQMDVNATAMNDIFNKKALLKFFGELELRRKYKDKFKIINCEMLLDIQKKHYPYDLKITEKTEKDRQIQPQILTDTVKSEIALDFYSPSKFSTFDHSVDGFFDRYILGLHEELTDSKIALDTSREDTPGNVFGTAIHYALQMMPEWMNDDFTTEDEKLRQYIEYVLRNEVYLNIEEAKKLIFEQCLNITRTPFIRKRFENIKSSQAEYYLTMPIGKNILRGYIDLLYKTNDGRFEIWDWKSNNLTSIETADATIANYEFQMRIYCYFVSRLYPEQDEYTARLLFTRLADEKIDHEQWIHTFNWTKSELDKTPKLINEKINLIREKTQLAT